MVSGFTEGLGATFVVASHLLAANPAVDFDADRIDQMEAFCLAQNIWHEARGTSREDRIAVAWTTLNRVRHTSYPDTICDVVWQKSQFSWTNDGRSDRLEFQNSIDLAVWAEIVEVTLLAIAGVKEDPTAGSTHYHAFSVSPAWASKLEGTINTDGHAFYRMDRSLIEGSAKTASEDISEDTPNGVGSLDEEVQAAIGRSTDGRQLRNLLFLASILRGQ